MFVCKIEQECFMSKYQLLVKYNGMIYKKEVVDEIVKVESYYDDYKEYDWMEAYNYILFCLGGRQFFIDLLGIIVLNLLVYFMVGRYDWNLLGSVVEKYFDVFDVF